LELPEIIEGWLKAFFSLFLKYRKIFRLPGISQRLVRLSKDLKRLRAILRDPSQAALYAVSILTEMSFAETTDLVAACGRLEIPVPCLFLNMATPDGPDPLCHSLFQRESAVLEKFALTFPGISRPVVYRQSDPRGIENLDALGALLYRLPQDETTKKRHSRSLRRHSRGDENPEVVIPVEARIQKSSFPWRRESRSRHSRAGGNPGDVVAEAGIQAMSSRRRGTTKGSGFRVKPGMTLRRFRVKPGMTLRSASGSSPE